MFYWITEWGRERRLGAALPTAQADDYDRTAPKVKEQEDWSLFEPTRPSHCPDPKEDKPRQADDQMEFFFVA